MSAKFGDVWGKHGLSIVTAMILATWIISYVMSDQSTHWGAFFGNAIADWSGLLLMILGSKYMMERGSKESADKEDHHVGVLHFLDEHSLSIFVIVTGIGWILLFNHQNPNGKWGQVVGNIVSEWTQVLGALYLTKRLYERGSGESK